MPDPSVFFSYATEDRPQVEPYLAAFASRGVGVWIDTAGIAPGQSTPDRINAALDGCRHFVVFFSARYAGKVWTREEMKALIHLMIESSRPGAEERTVLVVKLDATDLSPLLRHRLWTAGDPDRLADVVAGKLGAATAPPPRSQPPDNFLRGLDGVALEHLAAQVVSALRAAPFSPPGGPAHEYPVTVLLRGSGRLRLGCMPRPVVGPDVDTLASLLDVCGVHRRYIAGYQKQLAAGGLAIFTPAFEIALDERIGFLDVARVGPNGLRDVLAAVVLGVTQS